MSLLNDITRLARRELHRLFSRAILHLAPPTRRRKVTAFSVPGGIGDELMALGSLQALLRINPACEITFHSRYPSILKGLEPSIRIHPLNRDRMPPSAVAMTYHAKQTSPVMSQMAACLGIRLEEHRITLPRRPVSDLPEGFPPGGAPRILIQTAASNWTPNKQWPSELWASLLESLPSTMNLVEVGQESALSAPPAHPGFISLVGKTTLEEYVSVIQEADVFVGPLSSGMHLAHALGVPSVIILGGYELPHPYPDAIQHYQPLPCAPCWLTTPCPIHHQCLRSIHPAEVRESILKQLQGVDRTGPASGSL